MKRALFIIVSFILSALYGYDYARLVNPTTLLHNGYIKPFIYRALMPWIGDGLQAVTHLPSITIVVFLFGASGALFLWSLVYLFETYHIDKPETKALASFAVFVLCFGQVRLIYDFMTGFTFAMCIALLQRGKFGWYLFVFMIGVLNRETIILLVAYTIAFYLVTNYHLYRFASEYSSLFFERTRQRFLVDVQSKLARLRREANTDSH